MNRQNENCHNEISVDNEYKYIWHRHNAIVGESSPELTMMSIIPIHNTNTRADK